MVQIEWHSAWSPTLSQAFSAMPYDELMDVEVVRAAYVFGDGKVRQRTALLRNDGGQVVGIVPLKWGVDWKGLYSWQLLTRFSMPYARFYVLPEYTDEALDALNRYIACDHVALWQLPKRGAIAQPEQSWVVELSCSYEELMKRTKYAKTDRRVRKHAAGLDLVEDQFADLPVALDHWSQRWRDQGHSHSANRKGEMLVVFRALAGQGRLKTFSLYDGSTLVSMQICLIGSKTLYFVATQYLEEYREAYPGIRTVLAGLEWACEQGCAEADLLQSTEGYKKNWARPSCRSYRLVRGPFGSRLVGNALEAAGDVLNRLRFKVGVRR